MLAAIATWIVPAGRYDLNSRGSRSPAPTTVESHPQRILVDSLKAPINGMYGIENRKGNISPYNTGTLFGAIDVALFILVIGGFLGVTMKTGSIQTGIGLLVRRLRGKERLMIPILMTLFAIGGTTFGMAEEHGVLCPGHHRDDRGRLRRPHGRRGRVAGCGIGVCRFDDQPVRDRHRIRVRRHPDQRRHRGELIRLIVRSRDRHLLRDAVRRTREEGPTRSVIYDLKAENEAQFRARGDGEVAVLTGRQKVILIVFALAFLVMMYGVIPWDDLGVPIPTLWWWFSEMTASFLLFSIVIGLIARMKRGS